jgi:hypothetical protein
MMIVVILPNLIFIVIHPPDILELAILLPQQGAPITTNVPMLLIPEIISVTA